MQHSPGDYPSLEPATIHVAWLKAGVRIRDRPLTPEPSCAGSASRSRSGGACGPWRSRAFDVYRPSLSTPTQTLSRRWWRTRPTRLRGGGSGLHRCRRLVRHDKLPRRIPEPPWPPVGHVPFWVFAARKGAEQIKHFINHTSMTLCTLRGGRP